MEPLPPPRLPRRWLRITARLAEIATIAVAAGALGLWCSVPDTAPLAHENPTSTAFIDLRRAEAEAAGKPFTLRWQWRPLRAISRYLQAAVIYAEDYNFYHHDGIDWHALEHAISADWNKGAMSIGGSTITQQLAKNLYLSPRRSLIRKLREALIAFSLEDHLTKQRILEIYLNVVEWGDGVFGAEAAARRWFHHAAQSLSPAEAIRLAIALPNPITRAPNVRDPELTKKAVRLVRIFRMQGLINAAEERATLDAIGAPGERVLPDREASPALPALPTTEPPPPRAEPAPSPDAGAPAGEPSSEAAPAHATETGSDHSPSASAVDQAGSEPPPPGSAVDQAGSEPPPPGSAADQTGSERPPPGSAADQAGSDH